VAHTVLVVDVDLEALNTMYASLAGGDYLVTRASSFTDARRKLSVLKPDALVTAVRLGGFNGLHLVIRGRSAFPDIVAIVTHPGVDAALQAEAAAQQAVWMMNPIDSTLLRDLLARMLREQPTRQPAAAPRRWERRPVADQVEATLGTAQGVVVDVSYGGLRMRMSEPLRNATLDPQPLAVPGLGLTVRARPIWGRGAGPTGPWWYGIELVDSESENDSWRAFVDAAGQYATR
jgi:DNA-binding response OmpR family regulator